MTGYKGPTKGQINAAIKKLDIANQSLALTKKDARKHVNLSEHDRQMHLWKDYRKQIISASRSGGGGSRRSFGRGGRIFGLSALGPIGTWFIIGSILVAYGEEVKKQQGRPS